MARSWQQCYNRLGQLVTDEAEKNACWKIFPSEDLEKIAHLELSASECIEKAETASATWRCAHCNVTVTDKTRENVVAHVKSRCVSSVSLLGFISLCMLFIGI